MTKSTSNHRCRIALTGGPGAGKTTAADLFRREIGDAVVIVPEAATLLFSGGFPRSVDPDAIVATQKTIYHVQRNLEDVQTAQFPDRILLCDRGTVDGAAYWPDQLEVDYFEVMETTLKDELARYTAVLYFESAAQGGISIEGGNPTRIESLQQATRLDNKMRELWSQHPQFTFIPHQKSFFHKITVGLRALEMLVQPFVDHHNNQGS